MTTNGSQEEVNLDGGLQKRNGSDQGEGIVGLFQAGLAARLLAAHTDLYPGEHIVSGGDAIHHPGGYCSVGAQHPPLDHAERTSLAKTPRPRATALMKAF